MVYPAFVSVVGSKLYGINTLSSDTDIKGFGFAEPDEIIGLKHFEQQQFQNEVADGPDKIEGVVYDARYYIHLCMKGNPTVIEIAFTDNKFDILTSNVGKEICKFVRDNMLAKSIFKPYSAYLRAQVRKLENTKPIGKRKELVDQYGYDLKFSSHAIRLAIQGGQIMSDKMFNPTLSPEHAKICKDIRNGVYNKEQALQIIKEYDAKMYEAYKVSTLPESVDFNKVNSWLTKLYGDWLSYKANFDNDYELSHKFYDIQLAFHNSELMKSLKPIVPNVE